MCYRMGKLMTAKTPPFLSRNVRKYKRLCLNKAERMSVERWDSFASTGNNQGSALSSTSSPSDTGGDYADQSIVGSHAFGSPAFKFYHSWPREVMLQSGEKNGKWRVKVDSKHCPFCKPSVRCCTVKELVDHLDTYHSHFVYRPRRVGNSAIIFVRTRVLFMCRPELTNFSDETKGRTSTQGGSHVYCWGRGLHAQRQNKEESPELL